MRMKQAPNNLTAQGYTLLLYSQCTYPMHSYHSVPNQDDRVECQFMNYDGSGNFILNTEQIQAILVNENIMSPDENIVQSGEIKA